MRPEKIYISLLIIYNFIKSLRFFNWSEVKISNRKLRTVLGQSLHHYRMGCFMAMKPKVVITMIDNSGAFHWLSKNYKGAVFFAIQNALRTNGELKKEKKYYLSHFFCFGDYSKEMMSKYGHTVLNHYPIGSLRLGISDKFMRTNSKELYDIGIVSQYRKHEIYSYRKSEIKDPDILEKLEAQTLMHKLLSKYVIESKKKAAIIMVSDKDDEEDFYKEFYQDKVAYLPNNYERLSSFDALYRCDIVVGFFSSLIIEAFGLGRKILRIDLTKSDNWNDYDPIILLRNPSYEELKKRLDQLFAVPYETYRKEAEKYSSYLMNYNPDCPPHVFIRKKIGEYI